MYNYILTPCEKKNLIIHIKMTTLLYNPVSQNALEVTPNLSLRAAKLNAYLNAYNESCINMSNKTTDEIELVTYSTILVTLLKGSDIYQNRYTDLGKYWQSIMGTADIADNTAVEIFLDYLISRMSETITYCHQIIRNMEHQTYLNI